MHYKSSNTGVYLIALVIIVTASIVLFREWNSMAPAPAPEVETGDAVFDLPLVFPEEFKSPEAFRDHIQKFTDTIYFGSFPYRESADIVKELGVDRVVAFMSDTEKPLADFEQAELERKGLKFSKVRMPSKVTLDNNAFNEVKNILGQAQANGEILYFHCFLGDHRVNYMKYFLAKQLGVELPDESERIFEMDITNGKVSQIAENIYVGPEVAPEVYLFLLFGRIDTIVNLYDADKEQGRISLDLDQKFCADYGLECLSIPMTIENFNGSRNLPRLRQVLSQAGPDKVLYIHHEKTKPLDDLVQRFVTQ